MKPQILVSKLLPVAFAAFLALGGCRKKDNNPFPPALFNTRKWHQIRYIYRYTPLGVDTIVGPDTTASVMYIGGGYILLCGTKFYCPHTDPIEFKEDPSLFTHSTAYSLNYYVNNDSITYEQYSSYTGAYWLLSF